jgi:hypothetical protein
LNFVAHAMHIKMYVRRRFAGKRAGEESDHGAKKREIEQMNRRTRNKDFRSGIAVSGTTFSFCLL